MKRLPSPHISSLLIFVDTRSSLNQSIAGKWEVLELPYLRYRNEYDEDIQDCVRYCEKIMHPRDVHTIILFRLRAEPVKVRPRSTYKHPREEESNGPNDDDADQTPSDQVEPF